MRSFRRFFNIAGMSSLTVVVSLLPPFLPLVMTLTQRIHTTDTVGWGIYLLNAKRVVFYLF